ncbi:MAG TPA: NAD(P)(+) transhydrogenase (Re/Si-specific) subunit beta [Verrucomicrobiota bacterium]|nr:NAD(P)(+) transhydrogenase (Re/Si-specific) subunit beta [Verrucomicrobiota bacterium]HQB17103.1 NAD(P)(+) transhydrogenase (Re/Si-specific) subunit beta [Verrucomicrobiota bacterium]
MKIASELINIVAVLLFIFGLKRLSSPATARRGNWLSCLGMGLAVVVTLLQPEIQVFQWILLGLIVGSGVGAFLARTTPMTAMPEMVALLNGSGGLASLLVGWEQYHHQSALDTYTGVTVVLAVLIGGVTFTGSVVAWAKLSEKITGKPILFRGQQVLNALLLLITAIAAVIFVLRPVEGYPVFLGLIVAALGLGVLAVIPIGGADMPVVISLLNSYSGMAACATGFVLQNDLLIVTGSLVGSSGIILTQIMCKAMNRSLANVLFSGFGAAPAKAGAAVKGEAKPIKAGDAYVILEAARSVVFVPGYGMAVAQAQHAVRELGELLENNGAEVRYAIHPVAGRMPGHMNVLLAEAHVPYDQLYEMDAVNPIMDTVDVCVVIGANDVVNPAAHEDPNSPIYGMPIIEVERARTVIVLKRSLAAGFAGIENLLFYKDNTRMLFGDAKASLQALVSEFKGV